MNIGIYLDSVDFSLPSHHRFQTAILEGLARKNSGKHNLIVLTESQVKEGEHHPALNFVTLRKDTSSQKKSAAMRRRLIPPLISLINFLGLRQRAWAQSLEKRQYSEPAYYAQLRELKIDVLWYVTGTELQSPLPSIRTVLDINHRLHPEYWNKNYLHYVETSLTSIRTSSFIITGTNEGKRQLASLYNIYEPRIRVIPFPTPFLPDPKDVSIANLGVEGPYIFYPARFWRHKNHTLAVAALKVLKEKWGIRINLIFSGKGGTDSEFDGDNLSYVLNYAQTLGVADQVRHVGEVPLPELAALYKNALALAFVSGTGPDNLPPLEAMSMGCPAVVADVPGAREQYGDACLFFPPSDEDTLAAHIKFLLENPKDREALIAKGFERTKKWTIDDYGTELVALFDEFALIARAWGSSSAVYL